MLSEQEFGPFLREIREKKGVGLSELARKIGFSKSHLSNVEKGVENPSRSLLRAYESYLDLKPDELIGRWQELHGSLRLGRKRTVSGVVTLPVQGREHTVYPTYALKSPSRDLTIARLEEIERGIEQGHIRHAINQTIQLARQFPSPLPQPPQSAPQASRPFTARGFALGSTSRTAQSEQWANATIDEIRRFLNESSERDIRRSLLESTDSVYWWLCYAVIDYEITEALRENRLLENEIDIAVRQITNALADELLDYRGEIRFATWLLILIQREIINIHQETLVVDSTLASVQQLAQQAQDHLSLLVQSFCLNHSEPVYTALLLQLGFGGTFDPPQKLVGLLSLTKEAIRQTVKEFSLYLACSSPVPLQPS